LGRTTEKVESIKIINFNWLGENLI